MDDRSRAAVLFSRHKKLIYHAAWKVKRRAPWIDIEELVQQGCLILTSQAKRNVSDERFKTVLEGALYRDLKRYVSNECRYAATHTTATDRGDAINLDQIFEGCDKVVLAGTYVRAFLETLRQLLDETDRIILACMTGEISIRSETRTDWVRKMARRMNYRPALIYRRIDRIKTKALTVLQSMAA